MSELGELHLAFALSKNKVQLIQQQVNERYTVGVHPAQQPCVIILGAQPGAGKSELEKVALDELHFNAVVNNADNYRDFNPYADIIKKWYEPHYPELTSPYAQHWALGLQDYCLKNKLNYTLETTLRDGNRLNDTIRNIKEHGYKVDLKVLAVYSSVSLLGVYARYEYMKKLEGSGRSVSKLSHDSRYNAIPESLKQIEYAGLYDSIAIYGRSIVEGREKRSGVIQIEAGGRSSSLVYLAERDRELTAEEKRAYNGMYEDVIRMMKERGAPSYEIDQFKSALKDFPL